MFATETRAGASVAKRHVRKAEGETGGRKGEGRGGHVLEGSHGLRG